MSLVLDQKIYCLPNLQNKSIESILQNVKEYCHPGVSVLPSNKVLGQRALIAKEAIPANTVIFTYTNELSTDRTRTSIQIGKFVHIEAGEFGSFTNHSCTPNAIVRSIVHLEQNIGTACLITIVDIQEGEEVCFDYATTESGLTEALQTAICLCNTDNCRGKVKHFYQLHKVEQQALKDLNLVIDHLID